MIARNYDWCSVQTYQIILSLQSSFQNCLKTGCLVKSCLWDHYLSRAAGTAKKPLCPSWSWARSGLSRLQTWYNIVINIVQYTAQDQLAMLGDKENWWGWNKWNKYKSKENLENLEGKSHLGHRLTTKINNKSYILTCKGLTLFLWLHR